MSSFAAQVSYTNLSLFQQKIDEKDIEIANAELKLKALQE